MPSSLQGQEQEQSHQLPRAADLPLIRALELTEPQSASDARAKLFAEAPNGTGNPFWRALAASLAASDFSTLEGSEALQAALKLAFDGNVISATANSVPASFLPGEL